MGDIHFQICNHFLLLISQQKGYLSHVFTFLDSRGHNDFNSMLVKRWTYRKSL